MRGENEFIFLKMEIRVWWLWQLECTSGCAQESRGSHKFPSRG